MELSDEEHLIFPVSDETKHLFVTSAELWALHPINGTLGKLIDNKGFLPIVADIEGLIPKPFRYVSHDVVVEWTSVGQSCFARDAHISAICAVVDQGGHTFFRPLGRSGGEGAEIVDSSSRLRVLDSVHREYCLTPLLRPASYSASIWPHALNTIRIYAFQPPEGGGLKAFRAFYRFGSSESGPVDNRSAGGVVASIDLVTGRLGTARYSTSGEQHQQNWMAGATHPDSDALIEGCYVPGWPNLAAALDELLRRLGFLSYCGLDLALTTEGLRLIEINSLADAILLQVESPALADDDFRRFFEYLRARTS